MHSSARPEPEDQRKRPPGELPRQRDFFISYSNTDRQRAESIARALESDERTVYMQSLDFGAGGNFMQKIDEAIANSDCMLSVLSPDYLRSDFCSMEWRAQLAQHPTGNKLVPVRIAPCKPTGMLAAIAYIDLVGVEPEECANAKLLEDLKEARTIMLSSGTRRAAIAYGIVMGYGMETLRRNTPRVAFLACVFAVFSSATWLFLRAQFQNAQDSASSSLFAWTSVTCGVLMALMTWLAPRVLRLLAYRRWAGQ